MENILYKDNLVQNAREVCTEATVSSVNKSIVWWSDKGEESCGCKTRQKWLPIAILSLSHSSLIRSFHLSIYLSLSCTISLRIFSRRPSHPISLPFSVCDFFVPLECTVQVMPHPHPSWATWYATAPSPPTTTTTTTPCLCLSVCLVHPRNT